MKSQDIFLLLKLVSLAKQATRTKTPEVSLKNYYAAASPRINRRENLNTETIWQKDADQDPERFHDFIEEGRVINYAEDLSLKFYDLTPAQTKTEEEIYNLRSLALLTGISKSEISNIINRCYQSGLAKQSYKTSAPSVNTKALLEFIIYGIRYVFPVKMQELTRGMTTGLTAPIFNGELMSTSSAPPVWPDPKGNTSGFLIQPLFKSVPMAARIDPNLYAFLALIDSIRIGLPRERNIAITMLKQLLL